MIIRTDNSIPLHENIWLSLSTNTSFEVLSLSVYEGHLDSYEKISAFFDEADWKKIESYIKIITNKSFSQSEIIRCKARSAANYLAVITYQNSSTINLTIRSLQQVLTPSLKSNHYESILKETTQLWRFGFWEFYPNTGEAFWSNTVFDIFGMDEEIDHPSYTKLLEVIHPDDLLPFEKKFGEHLENRLDFDFEHRIIPKGQQAIWVRCRCTTTFDAKGTPLRSFGITVDIDQYKNTQFALSNEKAEFEFLFHNMGQGVVYQNKVGAIIRANKAAENLLGLSIEQLQGKKSIDPDWHAVKADGTPFPGEEHPAMVSLSTGKSVNNVEMGVYHPQKKETVWILISARPEFLPGEDTPYRVFTTFSDITALKEKQLALDSTQQLLNEKLAELQIQQQLQTLLLSISSNYIQLNPSDFETTINYSLAELGSYIGADRFYIFEYDYINRVCNNTYEWCAEGISAEIENLQQVPFEAFPEWLAEHEKGRQLSFDNVQALGPDHPIYKILHPQGIKSIITLPLMREGKCFGFIGLDFVTNYHQPGNNEAALLDIFSRLITNSFTQFHYLSELERYNTILEDSLNEIYIFDAVSLRFLHVNNAALQNIGYSMDAIKHMTPIDIKPYYNTTEFEQFVEPLRKKQVSKLEFVTAHQRKNGTQYHVKISLRMIKHFKSELFVAIVQDINEERIAQDALLESELRFRKIFEENAVPMILYNIDNLSFVDANKAALDFYGYAFSELKQQQLYALSNKPDDIRLKLNTLESCEYSKIETTHKNKDGQLFEVEVYSTLITYGDKRVVHEIIFDVSKRKKYLNTIEEQNQRFRDIAWMQSHVVRSPIARILGLIGLLKEDALEKDESDMAFNEIEKSAYELDKIVHEITEITHDGKFTKPKK